MRTLLLVLLGLPAAAVAQQPFIEAETDDEIWTLGDQEWDFNAITTTYRPLKGTLDSDAGLAVWILEIARPMTSAEAAAQGAVVGSPFKPVLLDEEKITLTLDTRVQLTPISGRLGDRVKVTVQLPKGESLAKVKLIRVERRSPLGF